MLMRSGIAGCLTSGDIGLVCFDHSTASHLRLSSLKIQFLNLPVHSAGLVRLVNESFNLAITPNLVTNLGLFLLMRLAC